MWVDDNGLLELVPGKKPVDKMASDDWNSYQDASDPSPEQVALGVEHLIEQEEAGSENWWRLRSFDDDKGFRWACVVRASGPITAQLQAQKLGIETSAVDGSEVGVYRLREGQILPESLLNRSLTQTEYAECELLLFPGVVEP
jgi:hypothetical protein